MLLLINVSTSDLLNRIFRPILMHGIKPRLHHRYTVRRLQCIIDVNSSMSIIPLSFTAHSIKTETSLYIYHLQGIRTMHCFYGLFFRPHTQLRRNKIKRQGQRPLPLISSRHQERQNLFLERGSDRVNIRLSRVRIMIRHLFCCMSGHLPEYTV